MQTTLAAVLMNAQPGCAQAFSDYYTHVHIRDAMRLAGSVAAQRFELDDALASAGPATQRFLALYEVSDRTAWTRGHHERLFTPQMPVSPHGDLGSVQEAYYDSLHRAGAGAFGEGAEGAAVVARIEALLGQSALLEACWPAALERMAALGTIHGGELFRVAAEQMYDFPLTHRHLVVLRTADPAAAMQALRALAAETPAAGTDLCLGAYRPLIPRLTAEDVRNPSAQAAAAEERERRKVGAGIVMTLPARIHEGHTPR